MRQTVPVIITSVIEINVGIIVGCMPYLAPMMRTGVLGFVRVCSLTNIRSALTKHIPILRTSKRLSNESTDHLAIPSSDRDAYLETRMLGSVDGKGKFLQSGTFPQKSWLQKSALNSHGVAETATSAYSMRNMATAV